MSPLSTGVLGAATLVSSPALWLGLVDRTLPLDVALTRYLIAIGICWAVLSLVVELAFPTPGSVRPAPAQADAPPDSPAESSEAG